MQKKKLSLRAIPHHEEHIMLMTGQVSCPPKNGQYTGLPYYPEDAHLYPESAEATLADYAEAGTEVLITDHPEGLRALRLEGFDPSIAFLFGADFGDGPTRLIDLRLAHPASVPANVYVCRPSNLPEEESDTCALIRILLAASFCANDDCESSLGALLGEAGIELHNREQARYSRLVASLGSEWTFVAETTSSVLRENQEYWVARRSGA